MNGKVEKKINKVGAMGYRKTKDGETMSHGPTYVIEVPESYTQEKTEELLDLAMAMPDTAVGSVIVVRAGVQFIKIDDGHHVKMAYDPDEDEDDSGWGED